MTLEAVPPGADDDAGVYARMRWRILPFLLLCYFAAHIDRATG